MVNGFEGIVHQLSSFTSFFPYRFIPFLQYNEKRYKEGKHGGRGRHKVSQPFWMYGKVNGKFCFGVSPFFLVLSKCLLNLIRTVRSDDSTQGFQLDVLFECFIFTIIIN